MLTFHMLGNDPRNGKLHIRLLHIGWSQEGNFSPEAEAD
jgi:hypothetical protein